jgi:hypothetical protein
VLLENAEMEINIQARACGKYNRSVGRLSAGVTGKRYHGFQCGDGRIIESPAPHDKQVVEGNTKIQGIGNRE